MNYMKYINVSWINCYNYPPCPARAGPNNAQLLSMQVYLYLATQSEHGFHSLMLLNFILSANMHMNDLY